MPRLRIRSLFGATLIALTLGVLTTGLTLAAAPPLTFVEFVQDGVNGVDGISNARDVVVSPDGKHVYAVGAADNGLAVFSRNATTGALTFVEAHIDNAGGVDGLSGAINVTTSPDGKHVYVSSWGRARARGVQPELDDGRSHVRGGSERWGGRR